MQLFEYERASALMRESGIDVILASSKHGVGYLSDYWHPASDDYYVLWDTTATHKTLVGLPAESSRGPFIVAGASEATTIALFDPWIEDRRYWGPGYYIQTWDDPLDRDPDPGDPMRVAADALREKGLANATIGIEERYLGVEYANRLQELLPSARLLDVENVLWDLRMIKSDEEIRRHWEACRRTGKAWLDTVHAAEEGMTEQEMQRIFALSRQPPEARPVHPHRCPGQVPGIHLQSVSYSWIRRRQRGNGARSRNRAKTGRTHDS